MSVGEEIRDLGKKAAAGKVSSQEFDIIQTQIMSSMYQESKYRHDEVTRMLTQIIENQAKADLTRGLMQKQLDRHEWYIRSIGVLVGLVSAWAVPNILDRLF